MTIDGSRVFQCISAFAKKEWMEKFDFSVKFNQNKDKKDQRKINYQKTSIIKNTELSSFSIVEHVAPDWVLSASEEINAELAQRHFEESFIIIQRVEDFLVQNRVKIDIQIVEEISEKMKNIKQKLATDLLKELSKIQSGNLPIRTCRRPLRLLIEMGKSREACGNFLRVCTFSIRTSQRQARRNNITVSDLFFCDVAQVASEFLRAFKNHVACTSALAVWCNGELQYFVSQLVKHYLTKGTALENVAKVVESVRKPCSKLSELGLNLTYHMEGLLRTTLTRLIEECKFRLIEPIGRTEDVWQPCNLHNKTNLQNTIKDFALLDIDLKTLITGNPK